MSRQKAGLRKEHTIASEIYSETGGKVIPLRAGWSGNQSVPAPDLLIPYKGSLRALEIKTSSQKRMVVDRDDLQDVIDWAMDMNEIHTYPYLTIKFTYYEAKTLRISKPWDIDESLELMKKISPFNTNVTRGGNISFGHPTHYDADIPSSSTSPGDGVAILRDLRQDNFANKEGTEMDTVGVHSVLSEYKNEWES